MSYLSPSRILLLCLLVTGVFLGGNPLSQAMAQQSAKNQPVTEQPWVIQQVIQLQDRSAKLEALLQQQAINSGDIKSAEKELQQMQVQLVELKEKLSAQIDNQSKELASYDRRISDVSWYTNLWGGVLAFFGFIITLAAIFMGWSAKNKAITEAKEAVDDYFASERDKLLSSEKEKLESFREDSKLEIDALKVQIKLQNDILLAQSIFENASDYEEKNKKDIALFKYQDLFERFKSAVDKELLDKAIVAKFRMYQINVDIEDYDAAVKCCDSILLVLNNKPDSYFTEHMVRGMFYKAIAETGRQNYGAAIDIYKYIINSYDEVEDVTIKDAVAVSVMNLGFSIVCVAKKMIQDGNDADAVRELNKSLFYFERLNSKDGMHGQLLGNISYANALIGDLNKAEELFALALRAEINGGKVTYEGVLADLAIHPVEQDKIVREFVEKQWQIWLDEQK